MYCGCGLGLDMMSMWMCVHHPHLMWLDLGHDVLFAYCYLLEAWQCSKAALISLDQQQTKLNKLGEIGNPID